MPSFSASERSVLVASLSASCKHAKRNMRPVILQIDCAGSVTLARSTAQYAAQCAGRRHQQPQGHYHALRPKEPASATLKPNKGPVFVVIASTTISTSSKQPTQRSNTHQQHTNHKATSASHTCRSYCMRHHRHCTISKHSVQCPQSTQKTTEDRRLPEPGLCRTCRS
jgi:hypothetical protein